MQRKGGFMEENKKITVTDKPVNTHFTLAVVAVITSCFTGFWTIPLALAALILSLRVQDLIQNGRTQDACQLSWWAGLFGWLTVGVALVPILLIVFFGGTILAFLGMLLS